MKKFKWAWMLNDHIANNNLDSKLTPNTDWKWWKEHLENGTYNRDLEQGYVLYVAEWDE